MTCQYLNSSEVPLDIEPYRRLHPDGRRLISGWLRRALEQGAERRDYFEAFIFLWFSFNGFATCVTRLDSDAQIVKKMANCPDLRTRFSQATENVEFLELVNEFATYWPVFSVKALRQKKLLHGGYLDRTHRVQTLLRLRGISHEPQCFGVHAARNESAPKDWPHVLHTIYRIRCNLFHGEKSPDSATDRDLVRLAFLVLSNFVVRSRVIDDV